MEHIEDSIFKCELKIDNVHGRHVNRFRDRMTQRFYYLSVFYYMRLTIREFIRQNVYMVIWFLYRLFMLDKFL